MIVIDASIVVKWIRQSEKFTQQALFIRSQHINKVQQILVPQLLFYEVANMLATKSDITSAYIQKVLHVIYNTRLVIAPTGEEIIIDCAKLAKKHNTSVYDMLYAVLAKKHKTILYTVDDRFIKRTGFSFVHHLREVKLFSS